MPSNLRATSSSESKDFHLAEPPILKQAHYRFTKQKCCRTIYHMPNPYSRVSNNNPARTYSGEKEGTDVVRWLNLGLFEDEQIRRVRQLISRIMGKRVRFRQEQLRVIEILRLYKRERIDWEDLVRHGINSNTRGSERTNRRTGP